MTSCASASLLAAAARRGRDGRHRRAARARRGAARARPRRRSSSPAPPSSTPAPGCRPTTACTGRARSRRRSRSPAWPRSPSPRHSAPAPSGSPRSASRSPRSCSPLLMRRELALAPSARATPPGDGAERVRSVLREAAPLAGALVLVSLYTRLHVVFVNAAEDAQGVAEYLLAFQFIEQLFVVAGILAGTLLPLLAARAARVDLLADRSTHDGLVGMAVLGASATAVLIAAAEPLVRLLGGAQLAGGATLPRPAGADGHRAARRLLPRLPLPRARPRRALPALQRGGARLQPRPARHADAAVRRARRRRASPGSPSCS